MNNPAFIVIDLFCGAGGTTTGFVMAEKGIAIVAACVNHDPIAIESHWKNHPEVEHFEEDITELYGSVQHGVLFHAERMKRLIRLANIYRAFYPEAKVILWASLECTNFSKAKGGMPREADSRTLAVHLDRYVALLNPDFIQIENVVEFMSWGPLDKKGKPISKKNGRDWIRWRNHLCSTFGYADRWKEMDSADYGAYTSRNRLFGIFAKENLPSVFPAPTHAKNPEKSMFEQLQKWKPVKDVLDFSDEGKSIFIDLYPKTRKAAFNYLCKLPKKKKATKDKPKADKDKIKEKVIFVFPKAIANPDYGMEPKLVIRVKSNKTIQLDKFNGLIKRYCKTHGLQESEIAFYRYQPLSEKTLQRIYAGLLKYVAGGEKEFMTKWNGNDAKTGINNGKSINDPSPVITTQNRLGLVKACFMQASNGGNPNGKVYSVERPGRVVTCSDNQSLVQVNFIHQRNGGEPGSKVISVDAPARTLTQTGGNQDLVHVKFLQSYYGGSDGVSNVENPSPTITTKDRLGLVQPEFMVNYNHSSEHNSLEDPSPSLLTKDRLGLVSTHWLDRQFSSGGRDQSIEKPAGSLLTVPKMSLCKVCYLMDNKFNNNFRKLDKPAPTLLTGSHQYLLSAHWLDKQYSGKENHQSVDQPAGTLTGNPCFALMDAKFIMPTHFNNKPQGIEEPCSTITANRKWHYLVNPSWHGHTHSIDKPSPVLIARQDKSPMYLVVSEEGEIMIRIYADDSQIKVKIKEFMACYGIVDIKMRMLKIPELKRIQGFPDSYHLSGSQADQKKFIGNSVVPHVVKSWAEALASRIKPKLQTPETYETDFAKAS